MLFYSFEFILFFLPASLIGYFILNRFNLTTVSRLWLAGASLLFYSLFEPIYLPLILVTIVINFLLGRALSPGKWEAKISGKIILASGLVFNIGMLGFYKYTDFFISNINTISGTDIGLLKIVFPLGISFFTFQQISFLVDTYRGICTEDNFLKYLIFVSFFSKIQAGPIVRHGEMMPALAERKNRTVNYENIARGLFLLALGLFKKTIIADTLAPLANNGFDAASSLNFFEAWITSLSYTLQLYFDFSGYTDMALGAALMFNIKLPINFDSPYRSLSIQEFWRRWHITLSRFLRDYIYIPLGGNRVNQVRLYYNILLTFLIGGIWHGAGWTFILWGIAHGTALVVQRIWDKTGIKLNKIISWFITFNFVNAAWVLFRARDLGSAVKVYAGMLGLKGIMLSEKLEALGFLESLGISFGEWLKNIGSDNFPLLYVMLAAGIISIAGKNSDQLASDFKPNLKWAIIISLLLGISLINFSQVAEFIYAGF